MSEDQVVQGTDVQNTAVQDTAVQDLSLIHI